MDFCFIHFGDSAVLKKDQENENFRKTMCMRMKKNEAYLYFYSLNSLALNLQFIL